MIYDQQTKTTRGDLFYYDDSGQQDPNRVIMFTTKRNLQLFEEYHDWCSDGTFDVSPSFFKQIYTIHITINNRTIPIVYFFLPNKKETTYKKML